MSKHTPGPWRINPRASGSVEDRNGRCVAACSSYYSNDPASNHEEENLANAHLIAAAPEILEALKLALPFIPPNAIDRAKALTQPVADCYINTIVRSAIAKAERPAR